MSATGVSLAVVIPTRNRATLAIAACESLLAQADGTFHLFVSDNSTEPAEVRQLADYCAAADPTHLSYLRVAEPMPLPTHWDWALRSALERTNASHVTVHYDRRITKPGHMRLLGDALAAFPADLVTWTLDMVLNEAPRFWVGQLPWTNRFYAIRTARVVEMTSRGLVLEMGQAMPLLSNCAVPRPVVDRVRRRFGDICNSTGPDTCFAFRFCATHERFIHYDRALGVVYASDRSTGLGYLRGGGGDFDDFMTTWQSRPWLESAPIPGLNLGLNLLFHEYELVRKATADAGFPPIDKAGYLRDLARGLQFIDDPQRAAELRDLLRQHGWTRAVEVEAAALGWKRRVRKTVFFRGVRKARQSALQFAARRLNRAPADLSGFAFRSEREALDHALACTRRRADTNPTLSPMQPVEIVPSGGSIQTAALARLDGGVIL